MASRLGTLAVVIGLMAAAAPAPAAAGPLAKALDYVAARQDPVAGGVNEGPGTDVVYSAWASLAVTAAGENPRGWRNGLASLRDAIERRIKGPMLGDLELLGVAAAASRLDPRSVGGRNTVREVLSAQGADGAIGDSPATTAWGILALRAGRRGPRSLAVRRATAALVRSQNPDGGWSIGAEAPGSGPNTTSAAIQALWAAGLRPARSDALARARRFLLSAQNRDGGFPAVVGGDTQALTTAWVTVAIHTLGEDPSRPPWSRSGGPVAALRGFQLASGGVRNERDSRTASIWATSQAALAFAGGRLPLGPSDLRRVPRRAPQVLWRDPAPDEPTRGALTVRYTDDEGGTGIDISRVRLRVDGRDVTGAARITPFALRLPAAQTPPGGIVRLSLEDRAGNATTLAWKLSPRRR